MKNNRIAKIFLFLFIITLTSSCSLVQTTNEGGNEIGTIVSIEKTGTNGLVDTYTITYSNDKIFTFTVTNGADGSQGIQGIPGKDGHTPVIEIGANGNWIIDGVDSGVSAKGDKGDQGEPGVGIVKIEKTSTDGLVDTYTIYYSNDTTSTFTVTNGENGKGEQGIQGIQGVPGKDGHTPKIEIGTNGNWIIDGVDTEISAGGLKGEQGEPGVGIVKIEKTSTEGLVDTYTIYYSNDTTSTFTVTNGENGKGEQGIQGIQGVPGKDGHTPKIEIGANGNWVIDGVDTEISAGGLKGEQGEPGVGIVKIEKTSTNGNIDTYTIYLSDDTTTTFTVNNGTSGKSAFEIFLEYYPDYEGTEKEWIDSLVKGESVEEILTVTFNPNNGQDPYEVEVIKGNKISKQDEPVKEGYCFDGWYIDGEKWSFKGHVVTENMTLKANWIQEGLLFAPVASGYYVTGLEKTFNSSVLEIPAYFNGVKITGFKIMYDIMDEYDGIGEFSNLPFEFIKVSEDNEYLDSRDNCNAIIETKTNKLLFGCINTTIPDSIEIIGTKSLKYCTFERLILPNTLRKIEKDAFGTVYVLFVPNSVEYIEEAAFNNVSVLNIEFEEAPATWHHTLTWTYFNRIVWNAKVDFMDVYFNDTIFQYTGEEHTLEVYNVPEGITVTLENNVHSEVGIYDVVAIFTNSEGEEVHRMTAKMGISEYMDWHQNVYTISAISSAQARIDHIDQSIDIIEIPQIVWQYGIGYFVTEIGNNCYCNQFAREIYIPNTVTKIFSNAFLTFNTEKIFIPSSVKYIESNAFEIWNDNEKGCIIYVEKENGDNWDIDWFSGNANVLWNFDMRLMNVSFENIAIPYDGEKHSIEVSNLNIEGITVEYLNNGQSEIGIHVVTALFKNNDGEVICELQAKLTIYDSNKVSNGENFDFNINDIYCNINNYLGNETYLEVPEYILYENNFYIVRNISIYNYNNVKTLILPSQMAAIGNLSACENLEYIYINKLCNWINDFAFENCHNLKTVYFECSEEEFNNNTYIGNNNILYEVNKIFNATSDELLFNTFVDLNDYHEEDKLIILELIENAKLDYKNATSEEEQAIILITFRNEIAKIKTKFDILLEHYNFNYDSISINAFNQNNNGDDLIVLTESGTKIHYFDGSGQWIDNGWRYYIVVDAEGRIAYACLYPRQGYGSPIETNYYVDPYYTDYNTNPAINILDGYGPWDGSDCHEKFELVIPKGGFAILSHGMPNNELASILTNGSIKDAASQINELNNTKPYARSIRLIYDTDSVLIFKDTSVSIREAKNRVGEIVTVKGTVSYVGELNKETYRVFLIDEDSQGLIMYKVPVEYRDIVQLNKTICVTAEVKSTYGQYQLTNYVSITSVDSEPYIQPEIDVTENISNYDFANENQNLPVYVKDTYKLEKQNSSLYNLVNEYGDVVFALYLNSDFLSDISVIRENLNTNLGKNISYVSGYLSVYNGTVEIFLTNDSIIEFEKNLYVSYENEVLSWELIENAKSYEVIISGNGFSYDEYTNSCNINDIYPSWTELGADVEVFAKDENGNTLKTETIKVYPKVLTLIPVSDTVTINIRDYLDFTNLEATPTPYNFLNDITAYENGQIVDNITVVNPFELYKPGIYPVTFRVTGENEVKETTITYVVEDTCVWYLSMTIGENTSSQTQGYCHQSHNIFAQPAWALGQDRLHTYTHLYYQANKNETALLNSGVVLVYNHKMELQAFRCSTGVAGSEVKFEILKDGSVKTTDLSWDITTKNGLFTGVDEILASLPNGGYVCYAPIGATRTFMFHNLLGATDYTGGIFDPALIKTNPYTIVPTLNLSIF